MNARSLIVIVLALVCGLSAVFLVKALRNPVAAPTIERTGVVFAVEDVKTGEMVAEKSVEIRQVPVEEVPEDAIRKVADAIDRAAKTTIDKGDMIRQLKLAEKGAGRGMAALIKPGMRAFTIQTPSFSSSLAGFLLPGNKVDVLLTASGGGGGESNGEVTLTLLQDVEILAVHTNVNQPTANKINPDDARSVTLQVSPEDARKLDLGQNRGTLHLTLRNPSDKGRDTAGTATLSDIQGLRPKLVETPQAVPLVTKIRAGMRAFTLDSESFSSPLPSHIIANSRVDILLTSKTDQEDKRLTGGGSTITLLKNIKILSIQPKKEETVIARADPGDARFVTVEVTPKQAERLDLGQQMGKLHLSLRGSDEPEPDADEGLENEPTRARKPEPPTLLTLFRQILTRPKPAPNLRTVSNDDDGEDGTLDEGTEADPLTKVSRPARDRSGSSILLASDLNMVPLPHVGAAVGGAPADDKPKVLGNFQVRTLRGTRMGADTWTVLEPTPPARARDEGRLNVTSAK